MDQELNEEYLRSLKYSKLRKLGKSFGIPGNLKGEIIVQNILSRKSLHTNGSCDDTKELNNTIDFKMERSKLNITSDNNEKLNETFEKTINSGKRVETPLRRLTFDKTEIADNSNRRLTFDKNEIDLNKNTLNTSNIKKNPRLQRNVTLPNSNIKNSNNRNYCTTEKGKEKLVVRKSNNKTNHEEKISKIPRIINNNNINKSKISAVKTPNFLKIHKKFFDNMESLDVYIAKKHARANTLIGKEKAKTPSQKPQHFVPSVLSVKDLNLNFGKMSVPKKEEKKPELKNSAKKDELLKQKKQNLRQSRQEKFRFNKPNSMNGRNLNSTVPGIKPPVKSKWDKRTDECRVQIKGVRTNRRFELQMKMRQCN